MDHRSRAFQIGEGITLAVFLAVTGLVFQQIATSLTEQHAASGDALHNAAMFPRLVAWTMIGLVALIVAVRVLERIVGTVPGHDDAANAATAPDAPPESARARLAMIGAMAMLTVIYLIALVPLGFHITTTLYMALMFGVLGVRPVWGAFLIAVGVDLLFAFVFEVLLQVVLPTGVFGIALPNFSF